jgi:cellulose synthase/poly-beta-1,6-N-acetylglucosamine synthase-like glycosyltransferase
MSLIEWIFWGLIFVVFYSYLGYGLLLFILIKLKRLLRGTKVVYPITELPEVTLFIAAYNERADVKAKMENTFSLNYPKDKLKIVWVTDGSDDGTPEEVLRYKNDQTEVLHLPERGGKIGAMNRGMKFITSPIVVFCDANTMLGEESIMRIVRLFTDPKVGCVSGEKRVMSIGTEAASATEGLYWKYESTLKKWDAELYSVVGAAGELFAVRRELYRDVEKDTLLDDFMISLRIAMDGYTIQYDPDAYAMEHPSANVKEELKRKVRISAGGIQSVIRLLPLLNLFKYRTLSFQYISHRVLRWTLSPLALPFLFILNLVILITNNDPISQAFYSLIFIGQLIFYGTALIGWYFESKGIRLKLLYVPFYFTMMNYAVFLGFKRFIKGKQSVNWERAKRAS